MSLQRAGKEPHLQLSANETLKPGHQFLEAGIVVKRRLTAEGTSVLTNFWLPGEMFYVSPGIDRVEIAALTKVSCEFFSRDRDLRAELERAELLLCWRALGLKDRLVAILEYLAPRYGVPVERGTQIVLTHWQLAELMGCTRETVNHTLRKLRRAPGSRVKGGWGKLIWRDA